MNPWSLRDRHPDEYLDWVYQVRNGDTLLGFADWFNEQQAREEES